MRFLSERQCYVRGAFHVPGAGHPTMSAGAASALIGHRQLAAMPRRTPMTVGPAIIHSVVGTYTPYRVLEMLKNLR